SFLGPARPPRAPFSGRPPGDTRSTGRAPPQRGDMGSRAPLGWSRTRVQRREPRPVARSPWLPDRTFVSLHTESSAALPTPAIETQWPARRAANRDAGDGPRDAREFLSSTAR